MSIFYSIRTPVNFILHTTHSDYTIKQHKKTAPHLRYGFNNSIFNATPQRFYLLLADFPAIEGGDIRRELLHFIAGLQDYSLFKRAEFFNLVARQFLGNINFDGYIQITRTVDRLYALALYAETRSAGSSRRYGKFDGIIDAWNDNFAACTSRHIAYGNGYEQILILAP